MGNSNYRNTENEKIVGVWSSQRDSSYYYHQPRRYVEDRDIFDPPLAHYNRPLKLMNELLLARSSLKKLNPRLIILIQVSVAPSRFQNFENDIGDLFRHAHECIVAPTAPENSDFNTLTLQPRNAHLLELR